MSWLLLAGMMTCPGWPVVEPCLMDPWQDPEPALQYSIRATLSDLPEESRNDFSMSHAAQLRGTVAVNWLNSSPVPVSDMLWHVYNNAWASPDSVWLREAATFGDERLPRAYGGTNIERVEVQHEGSWVAVPFQWIQPEDRTVLRLELPIALLPGQRVQVRMAFDAKLPPAFRRSGSDGAGEYLHAVQWYPKPGVWEQRAGAWAWNCEPYHYLSEFYADFASWDVHLTLPVRYQNKVAATGSRVTSKDCDPCQGTPGDLVDQGTAGGLFEIHWQADQVHDFAWTADPDFEVIEVGFHELLQRMSLRDSAAEERILSHLASHPDFASLGSPSDLLPQDVAITLMLQPEHSGYRDDYLKAVVNAIYWFGLWFGEYPYPTLAVIDPAHNARWTGGMEYPRLFTGGVRLGNAPRTLSPEGVTVHEFGHQFWYGLVGNDEFHHAWLDEGLTTWSTSRVMSKGWRPSLATWALLDKQFEGRSLFSLPQFGAKDPRALLAQQRWALPDLGLLDASEGELRHHTSVAEFFQKLPFLTAVPDVPRDVMLGQRSAFRTPWTDALSKPTFDLLENDMRRVNAYSRPALMLETFARLMGEERMTLVMRAFHQRWRYQHPLPEDFLAAILQYADGAEIGGQVLDWESLWQQAWAQNDLLDFSVHRILNSTVPESPIGEEQFRPLLEIRRVGSFKIPVEYRIHWSDGSIQDGIWDGQELWLRLSFEASKRRIVAVEVDPERRLMLDANLMNNSLRAEPDRDRALRWSFRAMLWAQQRIHSAGGTG